MRVLTCYIRIKASDTCNITWLNIVMLSMSTHVSLLHVSFCYMYCSTCNTAKRFQDFDTFRNVLMRFLFFAVHNAFLNDLTTFTNMLKTSFLAFLLYWLTVSTVRAANIVRSLCSDSSLELCAAAAAPPPPTECRRRAGAVFVTCSRHVVHQLCC